VETAPIGEATLIIRMAEHAAISEMLGNEIFVLVTDPAIKFIIANFDVGWAEMDSEYRIDLETPYPSNLSDTPFEMIMETSRRSPDINEGHDPFLDLSPSVHSWAPITADMDCHMSFCWTK
jgi:hypothetical protein